MAEIQDESFVRASLHPLQVSRSARTQEMSMQIGEIYKENSSAYEWYDPLCFNTVVG